MSDELVRSLDDRAAFDRAARRLGGDWSTALLASVPAKRRAELDARTQQPYGNAAQLRAWFADRDAGWAYVRWAHDFLIAHPRHAGYQLFRNVITGYHGFAAAFRERCEGPWLWLELVGAVATDDRWVVRELAWPSGKATWPAITHAIAQGSPHRSVLGARLGEEGGVRVELATAWLGDRVMRPEALRYFAPRVVEHEALLRAALADASPGAREDLVRLLRKVDPHLAADGQRDLSDDGELQARLRIDPTDAVTAAVWADLLSGRGDPRGEHLAVELAIATAEPVRALELSAAQAALFRDHRPALWNKPGGFPFREKYRGRTAIGFRSGWDHYIRGTTESLVERVQQFAQHVTTARAPHELYPGNRERQIDERAKRTALSGNLAQVAEALGGNTIGLVDKVGIALRRYLPAEPVADEDALIAACAADPDLTLAYRFQLTWPGSTVPLPYQEADHYPPATALTSTLSIYLRERLLRLVMLFPFEDFTDPRFLEVYEAISDTLGHVMTPSKWVRFIATTDGRSYKRRLAKFKGPKP